MSVLDQVLAELRNTPTATSLADLARRSGVSRDELDAAVGYWVHSGELVVEEIVGCAAGSCNSCPVAGPATAGRSGSGCGRSAHRRGPVLVTIRPAVSMES
jgi:hypothetical protein